MSKPEQQDLPTLVRLLWGKLMLSGRYDAAAALGALSLMIARTEDVNENELGEAGLMLIEKAVEEQRGRGKDGSASQARDLTCSFCGKRPPDVKIIQGPSTQICGDCVESASEALKRLE